MKAIRFNWWWFILALQVLNISIDPPDAHRATQKEDLSRNEQESIVELVLEKVLGIPDAVPEHDEGQHDLVKGHTFQWSSPMRLRTIGSPHLGQEQELALAYEDHAIDGPVIELTTPPPKA